MTAEAEPSFPTVADARGSVLSVTVVPRASKAGLERVVDGTLRIRLAAPPVDGAANMALLRFLADALDVPRTCLSIVGGATARRKRIAVRGVAVEELNARLLAALACRR